MKEVYPNLYVGNDADYQRVAGAADWCFVQAAKEPWHRQALGYRTHGAPKTHPEYLWARRGNRLILNLIDAPDAAYIPASVLWTAVEHIRVWLSEGRRVLVHCNQGTSRGPGIVFLYIATYTDRLPDSSFAEAEAVFKLLYGRYQPGEGMRAALAREFTRLQRIQQ